MTIHPQRSSSPSSTTFAQATCVLTDRNERGGVILEEFAARFGPILATRAIAN